MNYDVKAAVNINRGKSRLYCPMITQSKHRWLLQGAFVITTAFSFSSDWLSWKVTRVVLINHKAKWNKTKEILIHFWHLNKNHFTSDFLKTYLPSNRYFWYFSSRETFCHFGNLLAFLAKVEVRNFHTTNKWRKSNQELYENRLETRKRPNKEITEAGSVVQEINVKTNAITCEKNWAFSEGWVSRNQTKVVKTANKKGDTTRSRWNSKKKQTSSCSAANLDWPSPGWYQLCISSVERMVRVLKTNHGTKWSKTNKTPNYSWHSLDNYCKNYQLLSNLPCSRSCCGWF